MLCKPTVEDNSWQKMNFKLTLLLPYGMQSTNHIRIHVCHAKCSPTRSVTEHSLFSLKNNTNYFNLPFLLVFEWPWNPEALLEILHPLKTFYKLLWFQPCLYLFTPLVPYAVYFFLKKISRFRVLKLTVSTQDSNHFEILQKGPQDTLCTPLCWVS